MFRPPVVAILGHVDHGKTTLLDYIRKSNITKKEYGEITQSIGAYEVETGIKGYQIDKITFIDTPGHEAFSKLRSRGANVADIALLLIDAKEGVMPQTEESISHIKAAKIPLIVVLNKIDLPEANPEKVKTMLLKHGVSVEDKGGKIPLVLISAKTGKGVPELLEAILLLASDLDLKYAPENQPQAFIIETKKDKRGIVASAIIKDGVLKRGDTVFSDSKKAKVRSLKNDLGVDLEEVHPSIPFELFGFDEMPEVGSLLSKTQTKQEKFTKPQPQVKKIEDITSLLEDQESKKIRLIIKADSHGSLEAIQGFLEKNENIEIILFAVGDITKSDVFLAKTAKAIIVGFNVKPDKEVEDLAKQEKAVIKTYNIIYQLLEEVTEVAKLLREKEEEEKNLKGEAKVLATFIIHDEKILGIKVTKGKVNLGDQVEIYRDGTLLGKSKVTSLRIRAKKVDEVKKDQDAGVIISPSLDLKVGDMVKFVL